MSKIKLFQHTFSQKYNREIFVKNVFSQIFKKKFISQTESYQNFSENDKKFFQKVEILGKIESLNIFCYEILLQNNVKTSENYFLMQQFLKKMLNSEKFAFIIFLSPSNCDSYEFSFLTKNFFEVKKNSFLLGKNEKINIPAEKFVLLCKEKNISPEKISEIFSVEKLNKEFFTEFKNYYENFVNSIAHFEKNEKKVNYFVKNLLLKIIFRYFLQKKTFHFKKNLIFSQHFENLIPQFFDFLNIFPFSVNENSANEKIFAINPEILSYIFENLLENNKKKGTFYTSKEIVQYLSQESLIEYLFSNIKNCEKKVFENLIRKKNAENLSFENLEKIEKLLDEVKIFDPSLGSGAFSIGLLQEIFYLKEFFAFLKNEKPNCSEIKKNIIENSIFGIDIEKMAVQIAKLRLFLSAKSEKMNFKIENGNFLSKKINGKFDIVLGNPPFYRISKMAAREKQIIEKQNFETFAKTGDIYCLFYEKGNFLLKNNGVLSFITSNKWMRAGYGKKLREYFIKNTNPLKIIDFGGNKIFESATVDTNILIFQKTKFFESQTFACYVKNNFAKRDNIAEYFEKNCVKTCNFSAENWVIAENILEKLREKIEKNGIPLKKFGIKTFFGIITGFNKAFIIDEKTRNNLIKIDSKSFDVIKPILRGKDIEPYFYEFANLWLISVKNGWTNKYRKNENAETFFEKTYPAIYEYLKNVGENIPEKQRKGLYKRYAQGDYWWELRSCGYYDSLESEKIVWQRVTQQPKFSFVPSEFYLLDSTAFIVANLFSKFLLAILNSKVIAFYVEQVVPKYGEVAYRLANQFVEIFPIPQVSEEEQKNLIKIVEKIISKKRNNEKTEYLEKKIDKIIYKFYHLTDAEIKIIEKNF